MWTYSTPDASSIEETNGKVNDSTPDASFIEETNG
jgi:hypothetical protein